MWRQTGVPEARPRDLRSGVFASMTTSPYSIFFFATTVLFLHLRDRRVVQRMSRREALPGASVVCGHVSSSTRARDRIEISDRRVDAGPACRIHDYVAVWIERCRIHGRPGRRTSEAA